MFILFHQSKKKKKKKNAVRTSMITNAVGVTIPSVVNESFPIIIMYFMMLSYYKGFSVSISSVIAVALSLLEGR